MNETSTRSAARDLFASAAILSALYWTLDAFAGSMLFDGAGFPEALAAPRDADLLGRLLAAGFLLAFAGLAARILAPLVREGRVADERAARFRALYEGSADALLAVDPETGRVLEFSDGAAAILGRDRETFARMDLGDWIADRPWDEIQAALGRAAEAGEGELPARLRRKDGSEIGATIRLGRLEIDGRAALAATIRPAASRETQSEETGRDPLLGLLGRARFLEQLGAATALADRRGLALSLCLCDVDDLDGVNRRWGRVAGDRALAALGEVVTRTIRREDLAARYDEDAAAILFVGASAEAAASSIDRIRERVSAAILHGAGGATFSIGVTFGVAERRPGMSASELVAEAERALRRAKAPAPAEERLAA